jgi:membrane fusion protein (multidrug efflux system)
MQSLFRVYVVNSSNVVEAKEVKLGPVTGDDVVVESGLDAGEIVIVEGLQKVRPGMTVKPMKAGQTSSTEVSG